MKAKFIVIEGVDASGKHTQAELLVKRLNAEDTNAELVSFPRYEKPFGKIISSYLKGELGGLTELSPYAIALLYAADRFQEKKKMEQKLENGIILVADRYTQSNYGHQGAKLEGRERKEFFDWVTEVEKALPQPDLVIFLDAPIKATQKLLEKRAREKDLHEQNAGGYLEKTRQAYLEAARAFGWSVINCVDEASEEYRTREEISEEVWGKVKIRLE